MANKFRQLQLQTLDEHLASVCVPDRPAGGWIEAIRKSLGMSVHYLATRLGVAQQSVSRLQANEMHDSITLKSLRKVAEAMDCQLVYAIVPRHGSLQDIIQKQAHKKATEIATAVDHSMMLEGQAVGDLDEKIREITKELMQNINSKLWD